MECRLIIIIKNYTDYVDNNLVSKSVVVRILEGKLYHSELDTDMTAIE